MVLCAYSRVIISFIFLSLNACLHQNVTSLRGNPAFPRIQCFKMPARKIEARKIGSDLLPCASSTRAYHRYWAGRIPSHWFPWRYLLANTLSWGSMSTNIFILPENSWWLHNADRKSQSESAEMHTFSKFVWDNFTYAHFFMLLQN